MEIVVKSSIIPYTRVVLENDLRLMENLVDFRDRTVPLLFNELRGRN